MLCVETATFDMNLASLSNLNLGESSSIDLLASFKASGLILQPMTTLPQFVTLLAKSGIRGPHHISGLCLDQRGEQVGKGKQFTVFQDKTPFLKNVVLKRINVDLIDHPLGLDDQRKGHLRTLWLELLALSHQAVQDHANITKVLAWGFDYPSGDRKAAVPVLFMEKALCSLQDLLEDPGAYQLDKISVAIRHQLCLDVLEGLVCLHKAGFVHGDIKPANVLIFENDDSQVPFVAKLNDFGLCISLQQDTPVSYESYLGTPGWRAPELMENPKRAVDGNLLYKCDIFAFGLLVLFVFCSSHGILLERTIQSSQFYAKIALQTFEDQKPDLGLDPHLAFKLETLIRTCLDPDPDQRPALHQNLLAFRCSGFDAWYICIQCSYRIAQSWLTHTS